MRSGEIDNADDNGEEVGDARDLLNEAEDALSDAEDALDDEEYDDARDYAEEAEDLAIQTGLPILYGDNEDTKDLTFDRGKIQVLLIPKERFLGHPEKVKKMFACPVGYENDWINIDPDIECWASFEDLKIKAKMSFMEPHFVRYIIRFPKTGNWTIEITKEQEIIDSGEIEVVN